MKKVILLRGLPGSGKSTFAKQLQTDNPGMYKRINRDDMRAMLDNGQTDRTNEKFVKQLRDYLILKALENGKSVIVDDLNLSSKNKNRIEQLVHKFNLKTEDNVQVEVREIETDLSTCLERDAKREKRVGARVIRKLHKQFYGEIGRYKTQDAALPKAIICDLDGTLSLMNGRNPYDASACDKDLLNQPVADILALKAKNGSKIILFSGRLDTYKDKTINWLAEHGIKYDILEMRKAEDRRKDSIVKKEFYENYAKDKYFIEFVLDDRNQVVDLWRDDLGLPCFQVYYGDF